MILLFFIPFEIGILLLIVLLSSYIAYLLGKFKNETYRNFQEHAAHIYELKYGSRPNKNIPIRLTHIDPPPKKDDKHWKQIRSTISNDGQTTNLTFQLWVDFPQSKWNEKTSTPVCEITFTDKKNGYLSYRVKDKPPTKQKMCTFKFFHIQRLPELKIYSDTDNQAPYDKFSRWYCFRYAENVLKERLQDVIKQLK